MGTANLAQALMNRGVSRPTLYSVKMPSRWGNSLAGRGGVDSTVNNYLDLFCKNIRVPEGRLDVIQANGQEHMGIARETPQNFVYGKPLTMTVIENSDFLIYNAMRSWIEATGVGESINQRGRRTIKMSYYDSYVGDIELYKYENPNIGKGNGNQLPQLVDDNKLNNYGYKVPIGWRFYNAYPIVIGSLDLSSDATDAALEFQIDFTYESYSVVKYKRGSLDDVSR